MAVTITDVLNQWNELGVFSYVIPFLLIFAVVYAILERTGILSVKESEGFKHNRPILAIISASLALLALQFDYVSNFFAVIFPRFGIGLSIFLVLLIFLGFFLKPEEQQEGKIAWIGTLVGIGVVIWALSSWDSWNQFGGFGGWFAEYIWALIILGVVIALIAAMARGDPERSEGSEGAKKKKTR